MKGGPQQNLIRSTIVFSTTNICGFWRQPNFFFWSRTNRCLDSIEGRKRKISKVKEDLFLKEKKRERFNGEYLVKCRNGNKNNWIMLRMAEKEERFQPNSSPSFPTKEASFYFRWERTGFKLPPSFVSFLGTFINVSHFLPNVFIKLGENWSRSFNIG